MNRRASIGVLMLTAAVGLLGCSEPTGPEVVGEVVIAQLTIADGTPMGDGVIFSDSEPIDFPGIVMEQEGKTIEVRGAGLTSCGGPPFGVIELDGDQLTVRIADFEGSSCLDIAWPFAFRATTSDLESGSYDVRVIYRRIAEAGDVVVFTGTAEID